MTGTDATLRRRLTSQLLAGPPAREPVEVAQRLLAIQAQDPRGARLAIRVRSQGVTAADIDSELTERRSLLITWLNRGTLHLVASEDYAWLHSLTTPPLFTTSSTRLAQEGIASAGIERGLAVIERSLAADGPLTRHQLRDRLDRAGLPTAGQALVQLLFRAAIEGISVRGPTIGGEHAYVLVRDWLPAARLVPRDRALAELARRYLVSHGPASDRDLARWAGLPLRDARAGLESIASEVEVGANGLLDLRGRPRAARLPGPRLLGTFEPLLMGWRSREPGLGPADAAIVSGGIFRGFGLVAGRAAAVWRFAGREIVIEPFAGLSPATLEALREDALDVVRFLAPPIRRGSRRTWPSPAPEGRRPSPGLAS